MKHTVVFVELQKYGPYMMQGSCHRLPRHLGRVEPLEQVLRAMIRLLATAGFKNTASPPRAADAHDGFIGCVANTAALPGAADAPDASMGSVTNTNSPPGGS